MIFCASENPKNVRTATDGFYSNGAYMLKPVRFIVKADKLYNRTEKYRAVVAMSEKALYADIVLRKGIVR